MYVDTSARPEHEAATSLEPEGRNWFERAHELARTGQFRDVEEVAAALLAGDDSARPSQNQIIRCAIDIACLRARGVEDWHGADL